MGRFIPKAVGHTVVGPLVSIPFADENATTRRHESPPYCTVVS